MNFNMQGWEKSLSELHLMLKTAEQNIHSKASNPGVLMIREGRVKKNKPATSGKGKDKAVARNKILPPPKK